MPIATLLFFKDQLHDIAVMQLTSDQHVCLDILQIPSVCRPGYYPSLKHSLMSVSFQNPVLQHRNITK
jgi:hypothetical protein